MISDTIISDNERQIGIIQVFTPEDGVQGCASDADDDIKYRTNYFPAGTFGYVARIALVIKEDLVRWGLMKSVKEIGEQLEDFACWFNSENHPLSVTCGGETAEELYDGVQEYLDNVNYMYEEYHIACGFTTPEEALEEGTKKIKAFSRKQWYELIYGGIQEECNEENFIYLDMLKIFDFETWSEAEACYFRPPSQYLLVNRE